MKKLHLTLTLLSLSLSAKYIPSARPQWVLQNKLTRAIRKQHIPYIKQSFDDGAGINSMTRRGLTPLGAAAAHGKVQTVKYLIDHGAHINLKDGQGCTPLMRAAQYGRRLIVKYLLDDGKADPTIRDNNGHTASDLAHRFGHPNIARIIKKHIKGVG